MTERATNFSSSKMSQSVQKRRRRRSGSEWRARIAARAEAEVAAARAEGARIQRGAQLNTDADHLDLDSVIFR